MNLLKTTYETILILLKGGIYSDTDEPLSDDDKMTLKEWGLGDDTQGDIAKLKKEAEDAKKAAEDNKDKEDTEDDKKEDGKKTGNDKSTEGDKEDKEDKSKDNPAEEFVLVGKKEIPIKQYEELVEKAKKHYGEEDFEALPDKIKAKVLEDSFNILEAKKSADQRHRENADERKKLESIKIEFDDDKAKFEEAKKAFEEELEKIKQAEEENNNILKKTVTDEFDEDEATELKLDQRDAKKTLESLKKYKEVQQSGLDELIKSFQEKQAITTQALNIAELQENFPELKTVKPVEVIYHEINDTGIVSDEAEKNKMLLVRDVLENYYKERPKMTVSKFYEIYYGTKKKQYLGDIDIKKPERKVKTTEDMLNEIKKKQSENKESATVGGADKKVQAGVTPLDMENNQYAKHTGW